MFMEFYIEMLCMNSQLHEILRRQTGFSICGLFHKKPPTKQVTRA